MPSVRSWRGGISIDYSPKEREQIRRNLEHFGGYSGWIAASQEWQRKQREQRDRDDQDRKEGWVIDPDIKSGLVIQAGDDLIPVSQITRINIHDLADQRVTIRTPEGDFTAEGFHAIEAVMALKPSALEGRRGIRWRKGAWAWHNLIGHPIMQIMAWMGYTKAAIRYHDRTAPRPEGFR